MCSVCGVMWCVFVCGWCVWCDVVWCGVCLCVGVGGVGGVCGVFVCGWCVVCVVCVCVSACACVCVREFPRCKMVRFIPFHSQQLANFQTQTTTRHVTLPYTPLVPRTTPTDEQEQLSLINVCFLRCSVSQSVLFVKYN